MGESFAGITVPEGDPGGLRDSAQRMGGAAGALGEAAGELEGMPSMLGSWQGPASGSYAASCLSQSAALVRIADGRKRAASTIKTFADDLEQAREDARAAIKDAREATRRITQAQEQLTAARDRFDGAVGRAKGARTQLGVAGAGGVPRPDVQEALQKAEGDADAAEAQMRLWRDRLERAREDLGNGINGIGGMFAPATVALRSRAWSIPTAMTQWLTRTSTLTPTRWSRPPTTRSATPRVSSTGTTSPTGASAKGSESSSLDWPWAESGELPYALPAEVRPTPPRRARSPRLRHPVHRTSWSETAVTEACSFERTPKAGECRRCTSWKI